MMKPIFPTGLVIKALRHSNIYVDSLNSASGNDTIQLLTLPENATQTSAQGMSNVYYTIAIVVILVSCMTHQERRIGRGGRDSCFCDEAGRGV